jgi:hypothetical protein
MHERRANERVVVADMPALVIDRSQLRCFDATVRDFSRAGCSIISRNVADFPEEFGLQIAEVEDLIIARVLWRSENRAGVVFDWEEQALPDGRKEKRVEVTIPATISNMDGQKQAMCTIREASKSGCRIESEALRQLDNDVLIRIKAMKMSLRGKIVWRDNSTAGVNLLWKVAKKAPMLSEIEAARPPSP